MNMRMILIGMGLVGLGVALCGCQQPLCPRGDELIQARETQQAVDVYLQCRSMERNPKRRSELDAKIAALTPAIVEPVLKPWDAHPPRTVPQYTEAIAALDRVRRYDEPNAPWGIARRIEKYEGELQKLNEEVLTLRKDAIDHRSRQEWKKAIELINEALARDPDNLGAKEQSRTILRDRDDYYRKTIDTLCTRNRWTEATALLGRFAEEAPPPGQDLVKELAREVERTKTQVIRGQVARDIGAKAYFRAYTRLRREKPDNCDDLMRRVAEEGRKHYESAGKARNEEGDSYGAYVAAVKALKLIGLDPRDPKPDMTDPNAEAVFLNYRDCDRLVDDSLRAEICIAAFDSPASDVAAGKEFADRLATDFNQKLPYGLRLDDRRRVEYARTQLDLNVHDALQLVRVSWVVQGSISMKFVPDSYERDKTVFVSLKKTVANPHYTDEMAAFRKRYGKNESKWPERPSKTVIEESLQPVTYKIGTRKIEGQIEVSASIYSDAEGAVMDANSFRAPKEISVESSDFCFSDDIKTLDPDAARKVDPPKPLKMVSELEFKERLEKVVRERVCDWLLESFGYREKKFLKEAEDYRRQRQQRQAVEAAAKGYLYCLKADSSQVDQLAFAELEQLALITLTEPPDDAGL